MEGLSDELKGRLDNIDVVVEPWPAPDHLRGTDLSPSIVGMFRGTSLRHRSTFDPQADFPREIVVYQRNLEHSCRTRAEMVEQIRITLWHEIGHFLGLSEEDLGERGLD